MNIAEEVYESRMGITGDEYRLSWVECLFQPGQECFEAYTAMREAYERLLPRLNAVDDDPDLEIMVNSLLTYGKTSALKMFEYGHTYQKHYQKEQ